MSPSTISNVSYHNYYSIPTTIIFLALKSDIFLTFPQPVVLLLWSVWGGGVDEDAVWLYVVEGRL